MDHQTPTPEPTLAPLTEKELALARKFLELLKEHGISADEVEEFEVQTSPHDYPWIEFFHRDRTLQLVVSEMY